MGRARQLAVAFAVARAAYAIGLIVAPKAVATGWLGLSAGAPPTQVGLRGLAVRDLAVAVGIGVAARSGGSVRPWLIAQVAGDAADLLSTLAAAAYLPDRSPAGTIALAGGAGVVGVALACAVDR